MAEFDTSIYKLPVQKGPLDYAHQYGALHQQQQQIESTGLTIDKQKLDLANQGLAYMTRSMSSLGPNATKEQYLAVGQNAVKMGLVKPDMLKAYEDRLIAAKSPKDFYDEFVTAAATHQESINYHLGQPSTLSNGQTDTPATVSPKFGMKPTGLPIQRQAPIGTETVDDNRTLSDGSPNPNYGSKKLIGPQPPIMPQGAQPAPGGFPGQYQLPVQRVPTQAIKPPPTANPLAVAPRSDTGTTPDWVSPNTVVQNRFPTSLAPGVAEAAGVAGTASGAALAEARKRQQSFQRDIFPLAKAIPGLEKLGTKGTGPGTETINDIKSFILSNVPGINEKDKGFNNIKTYDEVKKYLTDFVNQTGNSGTNDKLAAAFAGNPSTKISNAAASDVAKAAMALRRMRHSIDLSFEDSGLQPDQASKFFASGNIKYKTPDGKDKSIRVDQLDPRAFGVDNMSDKSKKFLLQEINKNPREKDLFDKSLEIAIQHGYLTPR